MDCNPPDSFIQGSNPGFLHWEHGVFATGPPGKSLAVFNKADRAFLLKTLSFRILLPLFFFLRLSLSTWIPKGTSVQFSHSVVSNYFFISIQNKTQYPSSKFTFLHTYLLTESTRNVGDQGGFDPWVGKIPWRRGYTATHSSILAWRIPWTEEPGRLQSMGSQRVGHD